VSDDVSKLFPYAMSLITELEARAVIVLAFGSAKGMNGCAPALMLGNRPEDARENTAMVRAVSTLLRDIADRLERDMRSRGVPMEPLS
jgi:hypothetical protein